MEITKDIIEKIDLLFNDLVPWKIRIYLYKYFALWI